MRSPPDGPVSPRRNLLLQEGRALITLAVPVVLTQFAQRAIGITDVVMISHYDTRALGAAALGLSAYYNLVFLCVGPTSAFAALIAQMTGRGESRGALSRGLRTGLVAGAITAAPAVLLLQFTTLFLTLLSEPAELAFLSGRFAATMAAGLPFLLGFEVLRNYAAALGRPGLPLIVMAASILVNGAGNYALIFGHWGSPALGLWGSALASVISNGFNFCALFFLVSRVAALRPDGFFAARGGIDRRMLADLFRLGIPIGLNLLLEVLFFTSGAVILGYFGAHVLAAHQIANTITATLFMVPVGLGTAATIRIAAAAGAEDPARARLVARLALATGVAVALAYALLLALAPAQLAGLFVPAGQAESGAVVASVVLFLYFAAAYQVFDAAQVVINSLLRGLKDTLVPMYLAVGSYWLIGFPASIVLAFWTRLGAAGVWAAYVLALLVAASALWARLAGRLKRL